MRFSIATVSLGGGLSEKLAAIAAAGFERVEIFEADVLAHEGSPAEIGRLVRGRGLEVVAFQPFRDFEGMPEPQRARGFERAKRKFALMNELGAGTILVCSNVSPLSLGGIDRAAEDLRRLGELAEGFGIEVGFEALAWGRHVGDYRDAWEIVRRAGHASVGIILDSWHMLARGLPTDPVRAIPPTGSPSCSSPTRRRWRWTCCNGRGISATSPARATWTSGPSWRRCWRPATTGG